MEICKHLEAVSERLREIFKSQVQREREPWVVTSLTPSSVSPYPWWARTSHSCDWHHFLGRGSCLASPPLTHVLHPGCLPPSSSCPQMLSGSLPWLHICPAVTGVWLASKCCHLLGAWITVFSLCPSPAAEAALPLGPWSSTV